MVEVEKEVTVLVTRLITVIVTPTATNTPTPSPTPTRTVPSPMTPTPTPDDDELQSQYQLDLQLDELSDEELECATLILLEASIEGVDQLLQLLKSGELEESDAIGPAIGLEGLLDVVDELLMVDPELQGLTDAWPDGQEALDIVLKVLDQWDELSSVEIADRLDMARDLVDGALALASPTIEEFIELTPAELLELREELKADFGTMFGEALRAEQTPEAPDVGLSRADPVPAGELAIVPNWDVQVLEMVRGEEAWDALHTASDYNDEPPKGMEYLLLRIWAECTYEDKDQHDISASDFAVTGSRLTVYGSALVSEPEPELDAELYAGGDTEGWAAFVVGEDETDLILIVDELANWDDDRFRFIALEKGASIEVDPALEDIEATKDGLTRARPVPLGETAVTEDWEVTVLESLRGEDAWDAIQEANRFNDPPDEGMEYVLLRARVRYIGSEDEDEPASESLFRATGSEHILYDSPWVTDPEPELDADLYPGGVAEGWVTEQVAVDEEDLLVRFEPLYDWSGDHVRYLALEEGAAVLPEPSLSDVVTNTLGTDRDDPAPLGETLVTDSWEVTVLEVVRGDEAWDMSQEANQYNDPPDDDMEYVLVRARVRYVGDEADAQRISEGAFEITGDAKVLHEVPSAVDPDRRLGFELYPGGERVGWMTQQAEEGEEGLMLVFDNPLEYRDPLRYLALE